MVGNVLNRPIGVFGCHSNETKWPWYSNVAPFSFFVQKHVDTLDGPFTVNFTAARGPVSYVFTVSGYGN